MPITICLASVRTSQQPPRAYVSIVTMQHSLKPIYIQKTKAFTSQGPGYQHRHRWLSRCPQNLSVTFKTQLPKHGSAPKRPRPLCHQPTAGRPTNNKLKHQTPDQQPKRSVALPTVNGQGGTEPKWLYNKSNTSTPPPPDQHQ